MTLSERSALITLYFERLSASDIDGVIALFEPEAQVHSPFLGQVAAAPFFHRLGRASRASRLQVFDILLSEGGTSAAAYFQYDWTLQSGEQIVFQGVDHFTFGTTGRFAALRIFYDTHPIREAVGDKYG
ncbi:MAG: nuclear transport factor 2 family protein [Pseudomonadota bacterium]